MQAGKIRKSLSILNTIFFLYNSNKLIYEKGRDYFFKETFPLLKKHSPF